MKRKQQKPKFNRQEIAVLCGIPYPNIAYFCTQGLVTAPPGKRGSTEKRFSNRDALLFKSAGELARYGMTISTIKTAADQLRGFWETKSRTVEGNRLLDWSDDDSLLQTIFQVGFYLFIRRMENGGLIVSLHAGIVDGRASVIVNVACQPNGRRQLQLIENGEDLGTFDEGMKPSRVDIQDLILKSPSMLWINLGGLARELLIGIEQLKAPKPKILKRRAGVVK